MSKTITLIDLDINRRRKAFPNLALMKLSAYYKRQGYEVSLNFPLFQSELTFASCVFTWNFNSMPEGYLPSTTICGGSGINYAVVLPDEIENIMPDYSLYQADFSLGFTSRGCIRQCPFCIVPKKEGGIRAVASIYDFWDRKHKKIVLLDNNLFASPEWRSVLTDLAREKIETDFNQGLDIRLLDEEKIAYLKRVKTKQLRFAFDDLRIEKAVRKGIELLLKNGYSPRHLTFYVLIGFNPAVEEAVERMKILNGYGVSVFPMLYKDETGREPKLEGKFTDTILWHGSRNNLRKFLRVTGRLSN